jgi:hypothetical protein
MRRREPGAKPTIVLVHAFADASGFRDDQPAVIAGAHGPA